MTLKGSRLSFALFAYFRVFRSSEKQLAVTRDCAVSPSATRREALLKRLNLASRVDKALACSVFEFTSMLVNCAGGRLWRDLTCSGDCADVGTIEQALTEMGQTR